MRELIQAIQAETRLTTLFVTHDQSEALMMSHRVSLLLNGRLRQVGHPRDLFYRPADAEVARFFGGCNFIRGKVNAGVFHSGLVSFPAPELNGNGHLLTATIRPEDIRISSDSSYDLQGRVEKTNFEGSATRVWVQCKDARLIALTPDSSFVSGQSVRIHLPPDKIWIFPPA
jgi:ABC-type sugar transport system ATPase subunit